MRASTYASIDFGEHWYKPFDSGLLCCVRQILSVFRDPSKYHLSFTIPGNEGPHSNNETFLTPRP